MKKNKTKEIIYGIILLLLSIIILVCSIYMLYKENYIGIFFIILFTIIFLAGIIQLVTNCSKEQKKHVTTEAKNNNSIITPTKTKATTPGKKKNSLNKTYSYYSPCNYNKNLSMYRNKKK